MISHEHRFIFVHVGRTGGSSLERMAGMPLTADPSTRAAGNTDFPGKHWPFQRYRQRHAEEFRAYFKFTIVRNPFERLHSAWVWRTEVVGDLRGMPLREFIDSRPSSQAFVEKFRLRGMTIEESVATFDHVARFERLTEELRFLAQRLALGTGAAPPHANRTSRGDYRGAYDAATVDLVRRRFADDLRHFGYDFEG